jgi:hypothetical protein
MKKIKLYNFLITSFALIISALLGSCRKDFLDAKPSTAIVVPATLTDFQQLLDGGTENRTSSLPQLSCDDYYIVSYQDWAAGQPTERNAYLWNKDIFGGQLARADWNAPYTSIFYANSAISGLGSLYVSSADQPKYNPIKGQAYFIRAFAFFDLVKNFSPPYDRATAATDLGIPLKLSPNVDQRLPRSSVQQTYDQIISDLRTACQLLSPEVPVQNRNRASKPAAFALFARLYLSMRNYANAELYADSCLALYSKLIDYNTVSKTSITPFQRTDDETILWALESGGGYSNVQYNAPSNINIDTALLASYAPGDLRRSIYYITNASTGLTKARRGYSANFAPFVGMATDEVFLIKAECAARRQDVPTALNYLNALLVNRFASGTYVPYAGVSAAGALAIILQERRKELVWRGDLRWDDLRRLNKEGANITLHRVLNGVSYSLPPNSPLYVFPIPDDEIALSGIRQNIR